MTEVTSMRRLSLSTHSQTRLTQSIQAFQTHISSLSFETLIHALIFWLQPAHCLHFCMSYIFPLFFIFLHLQNAEIFHNRDYFFQFFLCFFCLSPRRPRTKKEPKPFRSWLWNFRLLWWRKRTPVPRHDILHDAYIPGHSPQRPVNVPQTS